MAVELISYDPRGVMLPEHGLAEDDLGQLAGRLNAARDEVVADAKLWAEGGDVPTKKQPLDAGFMELAERLLAEYRADTRKSQIGRIQATADRLAAEVDRVVILGIGGSFMGARALLEALCHPYYNELSAEQRRYRPRVYFEGNNVDGDAIRSLVEVFGGPRDLSKPLPAPWAIVVISKSGGTLETAVALRYCLSILGGVLKCDMKKLGSLVVPITGATGKLFDLSQSIGCKEVFNVPEGVGGRFSVLSAVGLLPAAIMGLNIVDLLEGAAAMNEHFCTAPVGKNAVLDYTGICHLLETQRGCDIRVFSTWGKRLEAVGLWYDQLLSESLGKEGRGAFPITVVNTRDLHSRGQQHQEGKRNKLITNVIVRQPTRDVGFPSIEGDPDGLNDLAEKNTTFNDILAAAIAGTNKAYRDDNRPTADLQLPTLNEHVLGQLFQMLMLATVVEGRLIGINPYGQPGVEAYKKNMNAILRGK